MLLLLQKQLLLRESCCCFRFRCVSCCCFRFRWCCFRFPSRRVKQIRTRLHTLEGVALGDMVRLPRSQLFNPIKRTTPSTHWREWHLEIWLGSPAASYSIVRTTPSTHWREWHLEIWLGSPAASYSIKRTTPSAHWREWHLEIWLGSPQPAIESCATIWGNFQNYFRLLDFNSFHFFQKSKPFSEFRGGERGGWGPPKSKIPQKS